MRTSPLRSLALSPSGPSRTNQFPIRNRPSTAGICVGKVACGGAPEDERAATRQIGNGDLVPAIALGAVRVGFTPPTDPVHPLRREAVQRGLHRVGQGRSPSLREFPAHGTSLTDGPPCRFIDHLEPICDAILCLRPTLRKTERRPTVWCDPDGLTCLECGPEPLSHPLHAASDSRTGPSSYHGSEFLTDWRSYATVQREFHTASFPDHRQKFPPVKFRSGFRRIAGVGGGFGRNPGVRGRPAAFRWK